MRSVKGIKLRMKIVHIFNNTNDKFTEPFIDFLNDNFNENEHKIEILGSDKRRNKVSHNNVSYVTGFKYVILVKQMYKSNKIILHALMSPIIVLILFFQPWLLKKCYWVIWGNDLYYYIYKKKNLKANIYESFRKFIVKRFRGLVTYISGDYELAKKWYHVRGKHYYSLMYPSNLYHEYEVPRIKKLTNSGLCIQIGNSADPSNNHFEILHWLERYKNANLEIICPLAYGDLENRKAVIKEGKRLFGDNFVPLTEFMPFEDYLNMLSKVDVAIFNHKRQQGMGNTITLLGMGKKVYIRSDITTWNFCEEHGLKVFDTTLGILDLFQEMPKADYIKNINTIKENFNENKLKYDWETIFNS